MTWSFVKHRDNFIITRYCNSSQETPQPPEGSLPCSQKPTIWEGLCNILFFRGVGLLAPLSNPKIGGSLAVG